MLFAPSSRLVLDVWLRILSPAPVFQEKGLFPHTFRQALGQRLHLSAEVDLFCLSVLS